MDKYTRWRFTSDWKKVNILEIELKLRCTLLLIGSGMTEKQLILFGAPNKTLGLAIEIFWTAHDSDKNDTEQ